MNPRWVEAALLLALAWVVAVPLSHRFARARWATRSPVAALALWQAIGLCGGLAVLTAELTVAAATQGGPWRDAVASALTSPISSGLTGMVGLTLLIASGLWLVGVLVISFERARRSRAEHRALLALLAEPAVAHETRFDVVDTTTPVAYSVPGRGARVVVTTAARDRLTGEQLRAVLAHERAHLRQRHTLLVQPFVAWQRSLPFLRSPALARTRVEDLVEMVCDDAARRATGAAALVDALAVLAPSLPGAGERVARLSRAPMRRRVSAVAVVAAATLVLLPPLVLLTLPV